MLSCTKSKEVHPEIGDANDEILMVGVKDVHVKYFRCNMDDLEKVYFNYRLALSPEVPQNYSRVEMIRREDYFELTITDLLPDTLYCYYYYIVNNDVGSTTQTESKTFHTQFYEQPEPPTPPTPPTPPNEFPEGAIGGLFSINVNGDQVYFSKGNLQYQASTNTWRFAELQWDYVGTQMPDEYGSFGGTVIESDNNDISQDYSGWIDLFGWGTSGWDSGNTYYHPWDSDASDGRLYGSLGPYDIYNSHCRNSDWGVYNPISNGGNMAGQWRTLNQYEWRHLVWDRVTASGIRYAKAIVNGINGVILLPDDWNEYYYFLSDANDLGAAYSNNVIDLADWLCMFESKGAVFLPAAGYRIGTLTISAGEGCYYWTAHACGEQSAYADAFWDVGGAYGGYHRYNGFSVRLVKDAN